MFTIKKLKEKKEEFKKYLLDRYVEEEKGDGEKITDMLDMAIEEFLKWLEWN